MCTESRERWRWTSRLSCRGRWGSRMVRKRALIKV